MSGMPGNVFICDLNPLSPCFINANLIFFLWRGVFSFDCAHYLGGYFFPGDRSPAISDIFSFCHDLKIVLNNIGCILIVLAFLKD